MYLMKSCHECSCIVCLCFVYDRVIFKHVACVGLCLLASARMCMNVCFTENSGTS